ncbi:ABC transporter ATP-binding protein [Clostridium beijerinckii]|uniref:Teichoic acids export ATP-binding protein TagH n=1 Tax=Clostridium beijerinckii TaxID=1520 RepID=A0A1S8SBC0_CLOBE|nr:ABC transporter ATP-binding protein [Clostridium beijerinckii]NRY60537.1 ABC-type polysaccharide/polyol phosphate transport system ATPase subunit [Clostridium beijerinckii]OOM62592.1 teichoic acids export ATP-binding protein TagH [Clostridium beijerinckii]
MNDDIAIKVENITKIYKLYEKPIHRLKESLSPFRKKYYREFNALSNVSFELKKGECLGIIGKNGAGKSTVLKIITGVLNPSSGNVIVNGRIAALLELGAGFNGELTGMENIWMQGVILGFDKKYMESLIPEILEFADIGDFVNQPVKSYSSGMLVRLAFAINSCIRPDILIVDEALSVGDFFFVQKCYKKIEEIIESGTSVIFVTHNLNDLLKFCNKAVLLEHGRCVFQGGALETMQKYLAASDNKEEAKKIIEMGNTLDRYIDRENTWIPKDCEIEIPEKNIESMNKVRCIRFGICTEDNKPARIIKQGEKIVFCAEFEVLQDIDIPYFGVSLLDKYGNVVHGKLTLSENMGNLSVCKAGDRLKAKLAIQLDLAQGEYTYEAGLGTIKEKYYRCVDTLTQQELLEYSERTYLMTNLSTFVICENDSGKRRYFHGICNLPSSSEISIEREKNI